MIRLVTQEDKKTIRRLCKKDPWNGTMVWASYLSKMLDTQNIDWQYCDLWLGTADSQNQTSQYLLCRTGRTFMLLGKPASSARWEELHRFLQMHEGKLKAQCSITTEYRQRFLNSEENKLICHSAPCMICKTLPKQSDLRVSCCQSVWQFYDVLASADKDFAANTPRDDFAARLLFQHRGGAQSFEVRLENRPIAVGTLVMPPEWNYSLLVNLCTLPEFRGQGLAGQIVSRVCRESFAHNKICLLECAEQSLAHYYERFGFQSVDFWQSVWL